MHNCRIGKTYFKYHDKGYGCNVSTLEHGMSMKEYMKNRMFIIHLRESGKINKIL